MLECRGNFLEIFLLCYIEMTHSGFFRIAKDLSICLKSTLWHCLAATENLFHLKAEKNSCEETREISTGYNSVKISVLMNQHFHWGFILLYNFSTKSIVNSCHVIPITSLTLISTENLTILHDGNLQFDSHAWSIQQWNEVKSRLVWFFSKLFSIIVCGLGECVECQHCKIVSTTSTV